MPDLKLPLKVFSGTNVAIAFTCEAPEQEFGKKKTLLYVTVKC